MLFPEVGIYKRKQENKNSTKKAIKKTRKQELNQEATKEKKKTLSSFLDHFLGRVLVFFYKFPPLPQMDFSPSWFLKVIYTS